MRFVQDVVIDAAHEQEARMAMQTFIDEGRFNASSFVRGVLESVDIYIFCVEETT